MVRLIALIQIMFLKLETNDWMTAFRICNIVKPEKSDTTICSWASISKTKHRPCYLTVS